MPTTYHQRDLPTELTGIFDFANAAAGRHYDNSVQFNQAYTDLNLANWGGAIDGSASLLRRGFDAANPDLAAYTRDLRGTMDGLNGQMPDFMGAAGYEHATAAPSLLGPASVARATRAGAGALMPRLEADAAGALAGPSALQGRLEQRALSLLDTGPGAGEMAQTEDDVRSAYGARGLLRSNRGVGAEILAKDSLRRQRLVENMGIASGVEAQGLAGRNAARNYALGVSGQRQGLNQFNAGLLTDTSRFNAGARNQHDQFGASLLQANNQFNASQANAAGQFNASATNAMNQFGQTLQRDARNDMWGRAMQYGGFSLAQAQDPMRLAGAVAGQVPDYTGSLLGYGQDLHNTNYNAIEAAKAGAANNSAAKTGAMVQGGASLAMTAKLFFMCVPEGQRIDTPGGPVAIEDLRTGSRVLGYGGQPVVVVQRHEYLEDPAARRFVCLDFGGGHTLTVCDKHRVQGTPCGEIQVGDVVGGREVKAKTWHAGVRRSYDLLTSDTGYRIVGVPVNSMIEEMAAFVAGKE